MSIPCSYILDLMKVFFIKWLLQDPFTYSCLFLTLSPSIISCSVILCNLPQMHTQKHNASYYHFLLLWYIGVMKDPYAYWRGILSTAYIYIHIYIYISLTACAVWALSWIGWRAPLWDVHFLHYASLAARSLSTLVTPQCNPNNV